MNISGKNFIFNYINKRDFLETNIELNCDNNFLYDYNEVQELYGEYTDNDVYIAGPTNLHKTDMLLQIAKNLILGGNDERNIIYLDFTLPFIRNAGIQEIISHFVKSKAKEKPFYAIIKEVTLCESWAESIKKIKNKYPFVKFLCSAGISPVVHEYFFDHPDPKSKIIVLSEKNESNIKYEQECFGTFKEFKYNIKRGICEIKGLTKEGKRRASHIIPDMIEGYPVKIIASGAFHHRTEMKEINLPDSIEYIGDYAFTYCNNLRNINLPEKLVYIGDCAFLGSKSLTAINGGNNITHIGNSAFYGTAWLENNKKDFIVIGKTLYLYKGKQNEVRIPEGIETIGYYSFANSSVKKINPGNVSRINEGAFYNCKNLSVIEDYKLNTISAFQFYQCKNLKIFPFRTEQTGKFAFKDCFTLEAINLSDAEVSDGAFENCRNLKSLPQENVLRKIGACAFYNTKLNSINLSKVNSVGKFSFYNSRLQTVSLDTANKIDDYAFASSKRLKDIAINHTACIGRVIFANCDKITAARLGGQYRLNLYFGKESPIKKLRVTGACTDNFARGNTQLLDVEINGESIGNWAFYANTSLKTVKPTVKNFGAWSFAYCRLLEEITLPSNAEYVSMNAFRYCNNLSGITIHKSSPLLFGANAFYSTSENKKFYVHNKSEYIKIPIWKEYADFIEEIQ